MSRERIQGCLEACLALSLQNKILDIDVLLGLGRILLNFLPGVLMSRGLNRRVKETVDLLSLLHLRVLLGLEEGLLLLLDILVPGEVD